MSKPTSEETNLHRLTLRNSEFVMPSAHAAERIVLGSAMSDTDAFSQIVDLLKAEDFGTEAHKRIFGAMLKLYEIGQETPIGLVGQMLIESKNIQSVGGVSALAALVEETPQIVNLEPYCETIRQKAGIRRAMLQAQAFLNRCSENADSPADLMAEAERVTESLEMSSSWDADTSDFGQLIEAEGGLQAFLTPERRKGIRIPFGTLQTTLGGLRRGKFILLAAKPAAGKSALAMQIAESAAFAGFRVLVITLEMAPRDLAYRAITGRAEVSAYKFREGRLNSDERMAVMEQTGKLVELGNKIRFFPPADDGKNKRRKEFKVTVQKINSLLRALESKNEAPDLIICDYLQLLETEGKLENRTQEVSNYSRGLKRIAKNRDVPLIAICNLSHDQQAGQFAEPHLKLLRDSGQLQFDGDQIVFLWLKNEPSEHEEIRTVLWKCAKNKDGMLNRGELRFVTKYARFIEDAEPEPSYGV